MTDPTTPAAAPAAAGAAAGVPGKPLTETMFRKAIKGMGHPQRSRRVEDGGFVAAIAIASLYGIGEFVKSMGLTRASACKTGIPYVTIILVLLLVLPKTIGRQTAGEVWKTLANRFGGGPA